MTQIVILKKSDGDTDKLTLPDLSNNELEELGEALQQVRITCAIDERARQTDDPNFYDQIQVDNPFADWITNMCVGNDTRKAIIEYNNDFFQKFMELVFAVAQDSQIIFNSLEKIEIGFGLMPAKTD